jgi:hypothetical protein
MTGPEAARNLMGLKEPTSESRSSLSATSISDYVNADKLKNFSVSFDSRI